MIVTYILFGLFGIGFLFLAFSLIGKINEIRQDYSNQEKKITDQVSKFILEKERELEQKISVIRSWEKYINISIGDPVYFETGLRLGEMEFTAYVEAEILDIAKSKAKIKVIDVSISKSDKKIIKQNVIDYLNNNQCWQELRGLEKRLSIEDRRDMQLNKILK